MKSILLLFILLFALQAQAQVTIYRTYKDFKIRTTGEKYDDYAGYAHIFGMITLKFKKDGKVFNIKCSEIWGFFYKDKIFRIDERHNQPAMLVSAGKIYYYENGLAHLSMLKYKTEEASFSVGFTGYFSTTINDEMVFAPNSPIGGHGFINGFKRRNPAYKSLFKCMKRFYTLGRMRQCVEAFERE